jgi:hypothetical protein
MDSSYYELTCECGRTVTPTAVISKYKHCGREIQIEWHQPEYRYQSKRDFRALLWSRPTPREDPNERRRRLEIMRFKKQVREAS